jgi:oligoendopeptidase F
VFKANGRVFTLITNTLPRQGNRRPLARFGTWPMSRHLAESGRARVVEALVSAVREAYPRLSHRYYALKARWFGQGALDIWDRNAPLPQVEQRAIGWDEARTRCCRLSAFLAPHGRHRPALLRRSWIDAPTRPRQGARAPSRTRRCPRRTRTCC